MNETKKNSKNNKEQIIKENCLTENLIKKNNFLKSQIPQQTFSDNILSKLNGQEINHTFFNENKLFVKENPENNNNDKNYINSTLNLKEIKLSNLANYGKIPEKEIILKSSKNNDTNNNEFSSFKFPQFNLKVSPIYPIEKNNFILNKINTLPNFKKEILSKDIEKSEIEKKNCDFNLLGIENIEKYQNIRRKEGFDSLKVFENKIDYLNRNNFKYFNTINTNLINSKIPVSKKILNFGNEKSFEKDDQNFLHKLKINFKKNIFNNLFSSRRNSILKIKLIEEENEKEENKYYHNLNRNSGNTLNTEIYNTDNINKKGESLSIPKFYFGKDNNLKINTNEEKNFVGLNQKKLNREKINFSLENYQTQKILSYLNNKEYIYGSKVRFPFNEVDKDNIEEQNHNNEKKSKFTVSNFSPFSGDMNDKKDSIKMKLSLDNKKKISVDNSMNVNEMKKTIFPMKRIVIIENDCVKKITQENVKLNFEIKKLNFCMSISNINKLKK